MRWLVDPFTSSYMQRALVEMVLLSAMSALAGALMLIRRLPFLADALSHTVFPGVAIAFAAGASLLLGALVAALVSSVVIAAATRQQRVDADAVMALLVGSFFSIGVIVVSRQRSFNADLTVLLFGRLLTTDTSTVLQTGVILVVVILGAGFVGKELVLRAFDPVAAQAMGFRIMLLDLATVVCVALVVVAGARAVGTALIITLLVTPVATARLLSDRLATLVMLAIAMTTTASVLGLLVSYRASVDHDVRLPPGATITVILTIVFIVVWITTRVRASRRDPARAAA